MADDPQQPARTIAELESLRFGFDDLPLEHFRGLSAEAIEAHDGIGPKFRERIQTALAELDAQRPPPPPPVDPTRSEGQPLPASESQPSQGPHPVPAGTDSHDEIAAPPATTAGRETGSGLVEPEEYLEPASPRGSGPLVFLMVVLIVAILVAVFMMAGGRERDQKTAELLQAAQSQLVQRDEFVTTLTDELALDAEAAAEQVYRKVRARNLGEALEHLDHLEKTLRNLTVASDAHAVLADRQQVVADAHGALEQARAAALLGQPMTQAQVEAAAQRLQQAVGALQGQEVKE